MEKQVSGKILTKEEILEKHLQTEDESGDIGEWVLAAMEEYAQQKYWEGFDEGYGAGVNQMSYSTCE